MKEIIRKNGRNIESCWLNVNEAAAYCGLTKSGFMNRARDLPHGGDSGTKLYHVEVLDAWIRGELDISFSPGGKNRDDHRPRRRK